MKFLYGFGAGFSAMAALTAVLLGAWGMAAIQCAFIALNWWAYGRYCDSLEEK